MVGPRPYFFAICAAAAIGVAGTALEPAPAQAQNLFDLLNRIMRGAAPPHVYRREEPRAYRSEPPRLLENFGEREELEEAPRVEGGPRVAYCVRLCDGRYFPLPASAGQPAMTPAQLCSAMCPKAKTDIFFGSQIEQATSPRGQSYRKLDTAFVYRERMVDNCTCTGRDPTGVARIEPAADPTLRPGDIVVTADGAKVFTGDARPPHRTSEFTPVDDAKRMPKSLRQQLSEIRVAPEYGPANVQSGRTETKSVGAPAKPELSQAPASVPPEETESRQN